MGSTPSNLSASRISAILGLNKYKSPLRAWLEIMEERDPGFCFKNGHETPVRIDPWLEPLDPKSASLRWGLAFEDAICDLKGNVINREKAFSHPDYPFITAHIDGQTIVNGETINQENKTIFDMAFKMGWGEPGTDMIDKGYMIQIQVQMLLSNTFKTDLNALVFPKPPAEWEKMGYRCNNGGIHKNGEFIEYLDFANNLKQLGYYNEFYIKADPDLQDEIVKQCVHFWNENILKSTPPPINGYDDIKWLIASPNGEIEATEEMKSLWSEKCDIENEISDIIERKEDCKNNFAKLLQIEIASKNVKPGNEDRKLTVYAGSRKLASISKPYPGLRVSRSMVDTAKENDPVLYEKMKKTTFLDIMTDSLDLTDKQLEKVKIISKELKELEKYLENNIITEDQFKNVTEITKNSLKILKSLKLTKLLSKESIMKHLKKHDENLFNFFYEHGIVEDTTPKSRLSMTKNSEE